MTIQSMPATQRIPPLGLQWPWKKTNFEYATATASEFLALRKHATDLSGQDFLRGVATELENRGAPFTDQSTPDVYLVGTETDPVLQ